MVVPDRPRLLLVEDNPDTAELICQALVDQFGDGCVTHFDTVNSALTHNIGEVDLVLTDMRLPDGTGLDVLEKMLDRRPDLPVVVITGEGILETALAAIRNGAYDYIVKAGDYLFAVPLMVQKNLAIWQTKQENAQLHDRLTTTLEQVRIKNTQLEEAVHQLETMAATDPLTGLANRRAFGRAIQRCFAEAVRYNHDLACVMIDLDGFKQLNDTLGHPAGDELLQATARVLEANCRRSDVAGRFGGDEFILVMPQTDLATAEQVAQRICEQFTMSAKTILGDSPLAERTAMSVGMATLHHCKPANPEQLIAFADRALYSAKESRETHIKAYAPDQAAESAGVSAG